MSEARLRQHARTIWDAGVAAAEPEHLVAAALRGSLGDDVRQAARILLVGGGKAGTAMARGVEQSLTDCLPRVDGWVNVPAGSEQKLARIVLHPARPAGSNHPTEEGVAGVRRMLDLTANAGPDDVVLALISGGGSALMPAPADGITLADKQIVTRLLHACGASIDEMNCVRKHLSRFKGGGLAGSFRGRKLVSLIISDVVGDPLDVIASGPTAVDPTTFADALAVLQRYDLLPRTPASVQQRLEAGASGVLAETLKSLPPHIENRILGCNAISLRACQARAETLGYRVLNLGSMVEGETREVAIAFAGIVRSIRRDGIPLSAPACVLLGGETTVTLGAKAGKGGRNQEFVLAMVHKLGPVGLKAVVVLSAGTDGEDGPTDAAGAIGGSETPETARRLGLKLESYLDSHDAYPFFEQTKGLIQTGLTGTNVMDIRVILIA